MSCATNGAKISFEVRGHLGRANSEHGVANGFLSEIVPILEEAILDHDLEVGDMCKSQMSDLADAFRSISACARRWERYLRSEAKHSFY
jgi:hypothetical protein